MPEFPEVLVRIASMSGSDEPQQSMFEQEIRNGLLVSYRVQKKRVIQGQIRVSFFFFFFFFCSKQIVGCLLESLQ